MILSKRVALGDAYLDELHERIVILSIDPGVPHESNSAVNRMGGVGQRVVEQHWETLEVAVTYAIDIPKTEMAERKAVFDMVNAWALKKGWLTVNWLVGRRMYVDKVVLPDSGDLWNWTSTYTITFRAYNIPFWQDDTPVSVVNANVTNGGLVISVPGTAPNVVDVAFQNISGLNITNVNISAGGNTLRMTGVNLAANQTLTISHGTDGLLRAYKGSTSVYSLITGSDDLYVEPGNVTVTVNATRAGRLTASCYGRWL